VAKFEFDIVQISTVFGLVNICGILLTRLLPPRSYLVNYCASVSATDEYTRHSVHVTLPYTGTSADNQLTPRQNLFLLRHGTQGKITLAANVLSFPVGFK